MHHQRIETMAHSQEGAVCADARFDNSTAVMRIMRSEETLPVSFSVGKDGEIKYWDGGEEQCAVVVGEGSLQEEWIATTTSSTDHPEYEVDEQDLQIALAMSEEDPRMDEELAKRLSELDSVPHVPKVNAEIPVVEASSDTQRLQDRLSYYGLAEKRMSGDGNCQFRALSDQLYRTPDHHMFVRRKVVNQLAAARDSYSGYVPMDYNKYLKNIAKYGEWGDHVTLQAAADLYGVKISLITTFKDSGFIEIVPAQQKLNRGSNVFILAFGLKFTIIQFTQLKIALPLKRRRRDLGFPFKVLVLVQGITYYSIVLRHLVPNLSKKRSAF